MKIISLSGAVCACVLSLATFPVNAALIDRGGGLIYDDALDLTWLQDAGYAYTQYVNSGGTEGDSDGKMFWAEANDWADGLSYYDTVRGVTYDDWRLPTLTPIDGSPVIIGNEFAAVWSTNATTDRGYAYTTTDGTDGGWRDASGNPVSEMGHMYYVNLGNLGFCNPDLPWCTEQDDPDTREDYWGLKNTGLFTNLKAFEYWTDSPFVDENGDETLDAWVYNFHAGDMNWHKKTGEPATPDRRAFCEDGCYSWAVRSGDVFFDEFVAAPIPAAVWLFGSGLLGLIGMAKRKKAL